MHYNEITYAVESLQVLGRAQVQSKQTANTDQRYGQYQQHHGIQYADHKENAENQQKNLHRLGQGERQRFVHCAQILGETI